MAVGTRVWSGREAASIVARRSGYRRLSEGVLRSWRERGLLFLPAGLIYDEESLADASIIAELRLRGFSLQKIRKFIQRGQATDPNATLVLRAAGEAR